MHLCYGLKRLSLGIDFTDEGIYVVMPLRVALGERAFAGDLITLMRPLAAGFSVFFRINPDITLYDLRLVGWGVHVLSFCVLSLYLFRLSRAPLLSPLVASVPFYVCHILGLAPPGYNIFSSDTLLLALTLRGLAENRETCHPIRLHVVSGLALFLATLAHAGLGLVGGAFVLFEIFRGALLKNLIRHRPTPSNIGVLTFLTAWLALVVYLGMTGAAADWLHRVALYNGFNTPSLRAGPLPFYLGLLVYPFIVSPLAKLFAGVAVTAVGVLVLSFQPRRSARAALAAAALALSIVVSFIFVFSYDPERLHLCLAQAALVLLLVHLGGMVRGASPKPDPSHRFLLAASVFAAFVYATVSFYFSLTRSWLSGILGVPFTFGVGLSLLLTVDPGRYRTLFRVLAGSTLVLAVACVAREHYRFIYRDAPVQELQAQFTTPKLRHIWSTPERVEVVDALCAYMQARIARGELLVAYDNCPMVYFMLDAMPAYNLSFAMRYTQTVETLKQLNREMISRPLPRYAIRNLVDITQPVWRTARRMNYDHYPLNETILANYELEKTIFPFEIWRLKSTPAVR